MDWVIMKTNGKSKITTHPILGVKKEGVGKRKNVERKSDGCD